MDVLEVYKRDIVSASLRHDIKSIDKVSKLTDTPQNREIIFLKCVPLVDFIVNKTSRSYNNISGTLSRDDITQSANYGLLYAIDRWFLDHDKNSGKFEHFHKFAYMWVYKYSMELMRNHSRTLSHCYSDKGVRDVYVKSMDVLSDDGSVTNIIDLYQHNDVEKQYDDTDSLKSLISSFVGLLCDKDKDILFSYYKIYDDVGLDDICHKYDMTENSLRVYVFRLIKRLRGIVPQNVKDEYNNIMIDDCDISII